ncbi:hypothetical protein [Sulfitobacter pontiacus]|uniref:hypothetical protein n=1 Tax=Sulfitobacter pontiacus TaxID=60137 RepID=UPI000A3F72BD|nr:hypothetical protein [Sulfitobacter pontiacus]
MNFTNRAHTTKCIYTAIALYIHATVPEQALANVGSWLDAEGDTVGRILAQTNQRKAGCALKALYQLHLSPDSTAEDLRCLLEDAKVYFEILLETFRTFSSDLQPQNARGLPRCDGFEQQVCWSGARIEETLATVCHALMD